MTAMSDLVSVLTSVAFSFGAEVVSWAELWGFVTGVVCVGLTVANRVENFLVGIANSMFFLVLFTDARLWADSGLQLIYIVLGAAGWVHWTLGGSQRSPLAIGSASRRELAGALGGVAMGTGTLMLLLRSADGAAPFWDAATTCLSLAAQWFLTVRKVQTWCFWIAADIVYVPLYLTRGLTLTAVVYVLFLGMAVAGLRHWRGMLRRTAAGAVLPPVVAA